MNVTPSVDYIFVTIMKDDAGTMPPAGEYIVDHGPGVQFPPIAGINTP
jgi:hypothetical protein